MALIGQYWIQKCLSRYAGVVVTTMRKLETAVGHQNLSFRRTFLHQDLGGRNVHTSAGQCGDLLKKMLTNRRKKKWYETPQSVLTGPSSSMKPAKKRTTEDSLRVRTLNTILYKAISDLLSSHEVHAEIPSYNVELTKVSLLADHTACRIYWKTSLSSNRDAQIQKLLDKCAPRIRYLLVSQQILGSVPPLVFVLDKQYAALKEVENLLKIADYGPSEDSEKIVPEDAETREHTVEKKRVVLGIDHDALYKQIEDYKQRFDLRDSNMQINNSASLTQEQLDLLAEIRKQKLIEKKKRKAKKMKDDDITPKEFLLRRQLQKEQDEQDECDSEDSQASERT
ncbi:putative ribosome-binding factor A, mitochondrial [Silurus meridionalis]|nr:putative ribosome-binding factor A, mitochondrial [Silurus meridionalis]